VYDYDAVAPDELFAETAAGVAGRGHWRFDRLLPVPAATALTAGEGTTPMVRTDRLADELNVDAVYVKDEGRNPTGTVLDRGLSLATTVAAARAEAGADVEPLVCASPGNAGQSMAAYAGRADLRGRTRSSPRAVRSRTRR